MVLDTGAGLMTISAKLARSMGLGGPSHRSVRLKTADGQTFNASLRTLRSVQIGDTVLRGVECLVFPEERGDVDPLLGQSFWRYYQLAFAPEQGVVFFKGQHAEAVDQQSGSREISKQ
jgi:clan AA aspartic protease (TIGR02281 family)